MDGIRYWMETEGAGHWFFIAFPVVLICLLIWFKGRRVRFLIPSLLISIVIINPWFYKKWDELGLYAYWRILWIIPVIPVVAVLVPSVTERTNKNWLKAVLAVAGVGLIIFGGTFLYNGAGGSFVEAANVAKLPDYVVQISDKLLELDEHPRVIADPSISTYIHQYTGEIDTLFGRDVYGYIASPSTLAVDILADMESANWESISNVMLNEDYEYLIIHNTNDIEGFELKEEVGEYGIYKAEGSPSIRFERNELGQVVSRTFIDDNGNVINNEYGYSKISYSYDKNGLITREFRTDVNGCGVADEKGYAGFEREYDGLVHPLMERYIDPDGMPVTNSNGFAEVRRVYSGNDIIRESYYDDKGRLSNRSDTGYALIMIEYDNNHNKIEEKYYNSDMELVPSSFGYASVCRKYEGTHLIEEKYYDENNMPILIAEGYAAKRLKYNKSGNITEEKFFGTDGLAINCINGYSVEICEYDDDGNEISQRYLDNSGHLVVTPYGYAEVQRYYDDGKIVKEEYFGSDSKPLVQAAGHASIRQEWDGDTLVSRTYIGIDSKPVNRIDGYCKAIWEQDQRGVWSIRFKTIEGYEVPINSLNLVRDIQYGTDGWSEWMIPQYNVKNSWFNIGEANLGEKAVGDVYTCYLEIEFRNVTSMEEHNLRLWTQGAQDGRWDAENVWNGSLISLNGAPNSGVYSYSSTITISEKMLGVSNYSIGFRCDYWASGMFRVRNVMIKSGETITDWSPGV